MEEERKEDENHMKKNDEQVENQLIADETIKDKQTDND